MSDATGGFERCPDCGAANPADATWCGQCHRRFDVEARPAHAPVSAPEPVRKPSIVAAARPAGGGPLVQTRESGDHVWTCPACEAQNPLEAAECARCGSAFTSFFPQEEAVAPSRVSGNAATALTAMLPGAGHWAFHDVPGAIARGLLYVWSLGIAVLLLWRPPASARTLIRGVGLCFALAAAAIWLLSMLETMRLVEGDRHPLVPPKSLTWFTAGLSALLFFGLLAAVIAAR